MSDRLAMFFLDNMAGIIDILMNFSKQEQGLSS